MTYTDPAIPTKGERDKETVSWWVEENPRNQVTSQGSSGKDIDIESELCLGYKQSHSEAGLIGQEIVTM